MLWIALAAAAQIAAPKPTAIWLGEDDTPVRDLGSRHAVRVQSRLTIAPDGRVHRCEIEESSGIASVDNLTCDLARRRALFEPARSADGSVVYGIYRSAVIWASVPVKPLPSGQLTVRMNPVPKGVHLPAVVHVAFAVDAMGQVSTCVDEPPIFDGMKRNNPRLVPLACEQVQMHFSAPPARDGEGTPVPSIQDIDVLFSKK
jgi:hypothetical protein